LKTVKNINGNKTNSIIKFTFDSWEDLLNLDIKGFNNNNNLKYGVLKMNRMLEEGESIESIVPYYFHKAKGTHQQKTLPGILVSLLMSNNVISNLYKGITKYSENEVKEAIIDYFTKGKNEVYNNLKQMASGTIDRVTDISLSSSDVENKRFPSFVPKSHLSDAVKEIQEMPGENDFKAYWKSRGRSPLFAISVGMKNRTKEDGGKRLKGYTSRDLVLQMLAEYTNSGRTYYQIVQQFGDKDDIFLIESPKYQPTSSDIEELRNEYGEYDSLIKWIKDYITPGTENYISDLLSNTESANIEKFANEFAYNYIKNNKEIVSLFIGDIVEDHDGSTSDLVKRMAQVSSSGMRFDTDIEGGIGKTTRAIVFNDHENMESILSEFKKDETFDGVLFFIDDYGQKLAVSAGDKIAHPDKFGKSFYSVKNVFSWKTKKGRSLWKQNWVNIDLLVDTHGKNSIYYHMREFMLKNRLDIVGFNSGVKKNDNKVKDHPLSGDKGSFKFFNGEEINQAAYEAKSEEVEEFVSNLDNTKITYLQDLRHDIKPKMAKNPIQTVLSTLQFENEVKELIDITNKAKRLKIARVTKEFDALKTDADIRKYVEKAFKKDANSELSNLLNTPGMKLTEPLIRRSIRSTLLNNVKRATEFNIPRVTSQELPATVQSLDSTEYQGGLKSYDIVEWTPEVSTMVVEEKGATIKDVKLKTMNVTKLARIDVNIRGVRSSKYVDSYEEAIETIKKDPILYNDLYWIGNDELKGAILTYEITPVYDRKGNISKWEIPGEYVKAERVPNTNPHSITLARVRKNHARGNFISFNKDLQKRRGSDFDGDQNFVQVLAIDNNGIIWDETEKGLANQLLFGLFKIYSNSANLPTILREIDVDKYEEYIMPPVNSTKLPSDIDTVKAIKDRKFVDNLTKYPNLKEGDLVEIGETGTYAKANFIESDKVKFSYIGKKSSYIKAKDKYEFFDPRGYVEQVEKNMAGTKMKAIFTNLAASFSIGSYYGWKLKKTIKIKDLEFSEFIKDKQGLIRAHIVNFINLAFDGGNKPILPEMRINPSNINLFVFMLSTNKAVDSMNEEQINEYVGRIINFIKKSPILAEYNRLKNIHDSEDKEKINFEIQERISKQFENGRLIMDMIKMSKDLGSVKNLYDLATGSVDSYEDYIRAKLLWERAKNNNLAIINTRGIEKTDLFKSIPETIYTYDKVFENNTFEGTEFGKELTRELLVENAQYADKDSIRQYNAMLHNTIAVNAIDPTSEINGPEEASDKVENLKKQYDLIVEQNKKLQNAGLPNGMAFLRLLSFELDRNVTVKQEDEYGKVKDVKKRLMTVRVQKEFSSFESVNKSMDEIQEAFNFLWTNPITTNVLKKIVYFNAVDKGLSSSVANGSLYPLTSTDFKNDLSNKINYELEQWKADVLTNEERAKFRKSLQDNFPYSYVDYNKRAIPVPKRMLTRAEEASKSIYYNENEKSPTTGARVSVDGENAILLKKEGETTTALDKRQQVIVLEKEYDVIGNYLTVPIGNNDYIVISPNIIIDATTGKNLYNDLSDVNIQLINTIMTNMPKAKQHTDKTMPLAAANPVLREFIRKRLNKMFPNVKRFQSWEEFEKFVNSKGGSAAMRSIGAAFADAVFVDEESARQDTELHEHGHIYYDSMEDNHPIKQALREMFYVEGMSIEDIDERVVVAIGQRGLSYAEAQMSMSQYGKFMQAMKYFWKWVKRMFGMQNTWANPLDYIVDQMWNHRQAFGLTPIYNNIVKYQTVPPVTNPADSIMSDDEKFAVNPTRTSTIDGEDKRFIEVNGKIINSPTSILNILSRNGANMEMIAYRKAYKNVSLRIEADKSLLPTEGAEEKKRQMIQQEQQRLLAQWDDAPLIGVLLHKIVELTNKGITDIKKIKEELAKEKRDGIENHIDIPEDVIENMVNKFSSFFEKLKKEGYTIYTELTVTNAEKLFKGVIDIIAINHKTKKIKIYDLKTSNYWADESNEQYVDEFDTYSSEVRALRNDKITRRALQLNMYAWAMKNMSMEDKKAFAQQINTSDDVLTNDKEGYAVEEISILETKYSYEQSNSQVTAINSIKQQDYKETSQRNNVEAHALAMINSVMVRNEAISIKNMTLAEAKKAGKDWKDQDGKKHRGDTKYYEIIKEQHDAESKLTVLFGNLENISANNIGNIFSYDFMRAIFKYIESEDKAIDYDMKIEDFLQIIDGPEFLAILTKDKFKEEMSKNKSIEQEYSKDIASFKAKNSSYTDLDIMYNQYLVYKKRFDKMLTEIGTLRTLKDYADEPINKNSINAEINYKLAQFQKLMMNIPPHISGSLGNWLNDFMNTAIMIREIRTENKDKQGYKPFTILLYKMINDPTSAYSDMKSYIMRGKEGSEMMRSSLRTTGAVAAFEILAFHEEGKMNRVIKGYEQEMKYARRHLTEDDMQKMVKYVDIKHGHVFVTPSEAKAIFEKLYNERLAYGKTESYKRLYERVIQSYNHRFNNAIKTGAQKGNYKYIRGYIDLNEIKGFLKSKGISVSDSKTSQLHNALKPSNNDDIIINITNPHSKILNFKWYKGYVKDPSLSDTMTLSELKHLIAITFDNMQSLNIPIEDRNEFVNNVIQFMNEKNKELKREKVKLDNKAIYVPSPSFSHMEVSIPTKKVFNSLFSHITKSAKSDYSSTLFPVFNYISNKYNKSAVNANQYLNLRKFDLYAVDKGLINEKWFKRLFIFPSLVYLGSSLKRATLNRLQGMATNFIVNLKYWRPFANINKFSKIARKENIGVQTLDIIGFNDSESKVMKFFEKGAFILNEKVDYWNIAEILAGAMTKDEASAYDSNGDIIPEKAHLAPTRDRWAYFRTVIASQGYYNTHKAMYKNDPVFSWAGTMVFSWSVPMVERVLGKYTVDIAGSRKAGVINTIGTWARIKMFNMFMSESKKIDTYYKIISNVLGNTAYKTKRDAVMALKQRYRLKNIAFGVDYDSSIVMKNGKYYIPDFNKIDKEFDKLLLETMGYVYDPSKKIESSEIISKNFNVLYNTMIFVSFCKILAVYLMANGDDDDKYGEDRYVTWKDVFSLNKVKKYKSSFSRPMNMNESQYRMYYAKEYAIETLIKITNDATTGGFTALASRTMDPFSAPAGIIKSATSLLTSLLTGGDTVETVSGDKYYGSNELIYKFLGIFAGYGNYAEDMIGLHRWFSAAGIKEDELKFMDQKRKEYVNTLNKAKWYGYDTGNMKESERIDLYKIINAQSESSVKSMGDQVLLNYLRANQGLIDNEMYVDIKGKDNDYERTKDLVEK
jgi:hypothetical protein